MSRASFFLLLLHKNTIKFSVSNVKEPKEINSILIEDYNYPLPDERIAKYPIEKRDSSKLLLYRQGKIDESKFYNIADFLPTNSLLVYNNTKVIQARLLFQKSTGARIEVFCLEPLTPSDYAMSLSATSHCIWKCMVGNLKKWKGEILSKTVSISEKACTLNVVLLATEDNTHTIHFSWDNPNIHFADILENAGELPIPPYLHRKTELSDLTNYQTVYSKIKGSVAAPTAGLHFSEDVFESLKSKHIAIEKVTLHVGAGTFQPVKTEDIADHHMHTEVIAVHKKSIENIMNNLGNIVAVGTTTVRTLESLYYIGLQLKKDASLRNESIHVSQWEPYSHPNHIETKESLQEIINYLISNNIETLHAETQIIIKPGFNFRITNGIITNFHQPKSTLLLLVSAFVEGNWKEIYNYALKHDFRFLSYGDSSLLLK